MKSMKKKLCFFILILFISFSSLKGDCLQIEGLWLECVRSYSLSCENSLIKDLMDSYFDSLVNFCSLTIVNQNGCEYTATDYYDSSDISYGNINENILNSSYYDSDEEITIIGNAKCILNNSYFGRCNIDMNVILYDYNQTYRCTAKLNSEIFQIISLKDNPNILINKFNEGRNNGIEYCKQNPKECGISINPNYSQNNCSSFDFMKNEFYVPCFNLDSSTYWLKFKLINNNPTKLELIEFGEK